MRLKKIKLAGFKSFVDPTTVPLPGQMVGVVGPNGCGKSNIIDAVRWVMGESSAKHLRGESMADVIFNGSNTRKPVGTASIELIFDNADGSLGGQYASYSEISVRRQVNRDAQSAYYLNGTRCRKRDITDVFLGTGLGPRSYSIIEQGMISRVIEARPEELRAYLEEAAGISLYKERRRETERRIRDTNENLERLDDVREEVARQLDKLQRQAETAERYKTLREQERRRKAELYVLRLLALERQRDALARDVRERETALEAETSRLRGLEREAEQTRARHAEESDRMNEIQGRYYALGSDIARIEQQISHQRELRQSTDRELEQNRSAFEELDATLAEDREKLAVLEARLQELAPRQEALVEEREAAREALVAAREALDDWRERWDRFNAEAAEPTQTAEVERARIEQLERRSAEIDQRRNRLADEIEVLRADEVRDEVAELAEQEVELQERVSLLAERLEHLQAELADGADEIDTRASELTDMRGELARAQGRLSSLTTLQEASLGHDEHVAEWLARQGLSEAARLAPQLTVSPGWEQAVERVLGDALQSVICEDTGALESEAIGALARGTVTLIEPAQSVSPPERNGLEPLTARLRAPWPLDDLIGGVYTADDLATARARRDRLAPGESIVTRDGAWLGRTWLRVDAGDDAEAGVLARERQINELDAHASDLQARIEATEGALESAQAARRESEERRDELADELATLRGELSTVQARVEDRRQRVDDIVERRDRLVEEREALAETLAATQEDIHFARGRLEEALDRGERLDGERERLTEEKLARQEAVDRAREAEADVDARLQDVALRLESAATARSSLEESLARSEAQRERLHARHEELNRRVAELDESDGGLPERREALLSERHEVEQALNDARARLGEADQRLREIETARSEAESRAGELREGVESTRLREYEQKVRAQTQSEQLAELGFEREGVLDSLPEGADETDWERELERLGQRIHRLGPINLAAIDEYEQLGERKEYLDAQHADLTEAMDTLESAIRRIDRETRQRFKETFEKVNAGLQRLFPRLFGGGQAYLEMTGDDLLETGVTIMARPPGKKISNIHLLSGGEKALTAVSLVFAIFELNPAPFCMLDEVDAPLDEANVGRFCDLVQQMSERVQFIVITHNKTTMAATSHLTGVTMNEPGVSRLVVVDVDEAAELAAM